MADNVVLDAGAGGDTIAADDVGGVKYQLIQLVVGADGGAKSLVTGSTGLPVAVQGALPAGTNNIGDVDLASALPAGTNVIGHVGLEPRTSGGLALDRTLSAASTNAKSIKASAGQVYGWYLSNTNASPRYVKLYNKASAPTVGTDTPLMTIMVPGGGGANVEFAMGIALGTGIALAMATGAADSDTGAVAANEVIAHILYK